jgi:hypothetical protein
MQPVRGIDPRLEGVILMDIEGSVHQWSLIGNKIAGHDGGGRGETLAESLEMLEPNLTDPI